jgi:hypothetical protein
MYTGVRVELSNGLRLDIFRGMAAIDKMDHFVMGAYLPVENHALRIEETSGATQKLRKDGVYPVYADCSDPSNTTGRARIWLGPNLLNLSKEELKSITVLTWEWNKYHKKRRPCGLGFTHFCKVVLDMQKDNLEKAKIVEAKSAQTGVRSGRSDQQGVRNGTLKRVKPETKQISAELQARIRALRNTNHIEVGRGKVISTY